MVALGAALGLVAAAVWTFTRADTWSATALLRFGAERPALEDAALTAGLPPDVYTDMRLIPTRPVLGRAVDAADLQLVVAEPPGLPRGALFIEHDLPPRAEGWAWRLRPAGDSAWQVAPWDGEQTVGPFERVRAGQPVTVKGARVRLAAPATLRAAGHDLPDELTVGAMSWLRAVEALRTSLSGERPGEARDLIEVSYEGRDPELAALAANAVADAVVAHRRATRGEETHRRVAELEAERERVRAELADAEAALAASRGRDTVLALDREAKAAVVRLAELRAERAGLIAERDALTAQLERAAATAPAGYRALAVAPAFLANPNAADLMRRLSEADRDRAAALTHRSADHPDVVALVDRIRELEEAIGALATSYRARLIERLEALEGAIARQEASLRRIPGREAADRRLWRRGALLAALETELSRWLEEARLDAAVEDAAVRIVERAVVPAEPAGPNRPLHLALGLAFGLVAGLGLASWREATDTRFGPEEDPARTLGVAVLARVPELPSAAGAFEPVAAEAFRHLRTNLRAALPAADEVRVLLVTSALPGDGKSLTATGLAGTLAEAGHRAVLVDADLRKPTQHPVFGTARSPGLVELLAGEASLEACLRPGGAGAPALLPAGAETSAPADLLDGDAFRELLAELRGRFDRVVIDGPPALLVADAPVLGAAADAALVVVRAGHTDRRAARTALERLRAVGTPIAGLVFNAAGSGRGRYPYLYVTGYLPEGEERPAASHPRPSAFDGDGALEAKGTDTGR